MKGYVDGTFITQANEGNLNVNSSDYWDNLGSPSDINAGDITDDGTYSNDTWVDTLFVRFTEIVGQVGNWTLDKSSYWDTSTDLDTVIDTDEITELKIDFNTVCGAGSHLYVSGNNLACETDDDTTYTAGVGLELDGTVFGANMTYLNATMDLRDDNTQLTGGQVVTLVGNWSSDKSDYWNTSTDLDGVIDTDEITELKIDFNTVCASGSHLYISGNNLACETDDDTTYTAEEIYIYLDTTTFRFNETELNATIELLDTDTQLSGAQVVALVGNWTLDKTSYSTTANIIAFGYYNSSDFIITDYFTKTQIENFGYYNSSDFVISNYFTSAEVLAFDYYNSTDFVISDYFTKAQVLGFNYYNSTDFVITDYFTKANIEGFGYYNSSNFVITDYATNVKVDSIGNFSAWNKDYNDLINTPTALSDFSDDLGDRGYTSNLNFTNGAGYYNSTDFSISDYYLKSNPFSFYNSTDFSITDYTLTATIDGYSLSHWADDLGNRGYTHLTNFSDNLGNRGYTDLVNFTNSPGYLTSETDPIFTAWDNFTGIPHATPSNGDITHFSYADEIYDWVIGLGYATTTYVDNLIGTYTHLTNFTDNLGNRGYTSNLNFTNGAGYYNSSDFVITDYFTSAQVLGFSYYNSTDFVIGDYYLKSNPFSFYNSTNPQTETDPLWTGNQSSYSTKAVADTLYAPINYGDDWNKTYADTLYADISVVSNPFDQELNTTSNVQFNNVTASNVTISNCILFTNGAQLCGI